MARRAAAELPGSTFDAIVRSVGEAKSNADETELVRRMISIVKEGLAQNSITPKVERDILLYLVYIDMLGHDTAWAHASVIRMCSSKNLLVKKVAYLAASLLIDPASELTIMVTATIQSDLKSDNFLIVGAAQHAVSRFARPELVSVFLPQMIELLKHDKDVIKKKSLLVLHKFLQLDPSLAPDLERHLIEKLGYKEPSVMVAALCGLQELIQHNPGAYKNLVHYFTSILKQASEGKLGHSYDYHRAPAPFVQIHLLRLLSLLGAADASCANNMSSVIAEVWRRGEALGNTIGNALVYECLRTVATIQCGDSFAKHKLASITRLLSSHDNNLKYAAIDVLSRLLKDDITAAQQHQYAVVECLRSADSTLKLKTLNLLYAMASPGNIDVVAREALDYLGQADDDVAKREAAMQLCDVAEKFAPDQIWFVDTLSELFEIAGDVLPPSVSDHLIAVFTKETSTKYGSSPSIDLPHKYVKAYLNLLDRPKLPSVLLKVICWVVGEYGSVAEGGAHAAMDKLASIPETQAPDEDVSSYLLAALGKLGVKALGQLTPDAERYLDGMTRAEAALLQQQAVELKELLKAGPEIQAAAFPSSTVPNGHQAEPNLSFLDDYVQQALTAGAVPYIDLNDRVAMGMSAAPEVFMPQHRQSALKYSAYAEAPRPAAPVMLDQQYDQQHGPSALLSTSTGRSASSAGIGGLGPIGMTSASPISGAADKGLNSMEPKLMLGKKERKWGPQAAPSPLPPLQNTSTPSSTSATPPPPSGQPVNSGGGSSTTYGGLADFNNPSWQSSGRPGSRQPTPPPARDPEKERLAASLFGGGGASSDQQRKRQDVAVPDLLGGLDLSPSKAASAAPTSVMDLLGELNAPAPSVVSSSTVPAGQQDLYGLFDLTSAPAPPSQMGGGMPFQTMSSSSPAAGAINTKPQSGNISNKDPFASLLD